MAKNKHKQDPIPENFDTFEELADFWDNHDLTDYEEYITPVEMELESELSHEYVVVLSDSLVEQLRKVQKREGVSINTLINLWVQEKLLTDPSAK
jgi:hypothetical protein